MSSVWTDEQNGTNSYPTGGFTITTSLSTLTYFDVRVKTPGANLGQVVCDVTLNSPGAGQATVKLVRANYDKVTTIGSPTSLPSGVSNRSSSGGTVDTVSHSHSIDHNHAATPASTTPSGASVNVLASAASPNVTTHTHTMDLPNHTGTSGAEAAHNHTFDVLYQHQQTLTNTQTDLAGSELANGTDLSGTTFDFLAVA